MSFNINLTITGIQEAMAANLRRIAMLQPTSALGRLVRDVAVELHRFAVGITHLGRYRKTASGSYTYDASGGIGGGALRASHRIEVNGLSARVFIDPGAVNPLTRAKPYIYGLYENARGAEHAFYTRTVAEKWPQAAEQYGANFLVQLVEAGV